MSSEEAQSIVYSETERTILAIRALLFAYPCHGILWSMYYVCKVFYVLKPKDRDDEDMVCFPIMIEQDSLFYQECMFIENLNEICDGFYVGKRVCFMIYEDNPYVIPVAWISQIYAWRSEETRETKLVNYTQDEKDVQDEKPTELVVKRFFAKITFYLYRRSFCCRLNVVVEDFPSCMTRQSIRIPSRVFREIFHIGIDECQLTNCHKIYESLSLVIGFKEIENAITSLASGRSKNYAIIKSCVFQGLMKRRNSEIVAHCLLCKSCFLLLDDVIRDFCHRYEYNDTYEEIYLTESDKCMHIDLLYMISRASCKDVSEWLGRFTNRKRHSVFDF